MKAIITKYLPVTNTKPSRVKAFDADGHSITLGFHSGKSDTEHGIYREAAEALRDKMGWKGELVGGGIKDGYVWCFKDSTL